MISLETGGEQVGDNDAANSDAKESAPTRTHTLGNVCRRGRGIVEGESSVKVITAAEAASGDLVVASLARARKHKRRFGAVITLEDPACRPAQRLRFTKQPVPPHLVLAFEDVDDDTLGVRVATSEQVADALEFARAHSSGSLLIHCLHGVGRSAGVGLAVLADRLGVGCESQAVAQLFTIRPEATPNLVVVKLADDLLGRRGALIRALDAWEAAQPDMHGKREARLQMVRLNPQLYSWLE